MSLQALAGEYFRRQLPVGRWLHPRLLGAASNRIAVHALNKDSDLLDRAATRFLELHSDLFEADGESARRIVA